MMLEEAPTGTWSSLSLQTGTLRPRSIIPCCWDQLSRVWLFMTTGIFPVASSVQGKTTWCSDFVVEVKDILRYFMQITPELFVFMLSRRRVNWGEK